MIETTFVSENRRADPESTDWIKTIVLLLPPTSSVPSRPALFWERLGVWHEQIVKRSERDEEWITERLAKLDYKFLSAVTQWMGSTVEHPTLRNLAASFTKEVLVQLAIKSPTERAATLLMLDLLLHGRSHRAVADMGQLLLPPSVVEALSQSPLNPRSQRLLTAFLIYCEEPENLQLVMLYERAERYRYNRYTMVPQIEENGTVRLDGAEFAPPQKAGHRNLAHRRSASFQDKENVRGTSDTEAGVRGTIALEVINNALRRFESGPSGGRNSVCLRVLNHSDGATMVFIYRNLQQRSISEMTRTLFGEQVETIVLKFYRKYQILEARSTKGIGHLIAQSIVTEILGQRVRYIDDAKRTPLPALRRFVAAIRHGEDPKLKLVEVYLSSAPLPESPNLILRGTREHPLTRTIDFLEQRDCLLFEDLEDVRHVGVAFSTDDCGQAVSHLFKLRFDIQAVEWAVTRYLTTHANSRICSAFESHLLNCYDVTAIPTAR